jgi:hypothetical protein
MTQKKTKQPLRVQIIGQLAELLPRIKHRKAAHKVTTETLLANEHEKRLSASTLRRHLDFARKKAAIKAPDHAEDIKAL